MNTQRLTTELVYCSWDVSQGEAAVSVPLFYLYQPLFFFTGIRRINLGPSHSAYDFLVSSIQALSLFITSLVLVLSGLFPSLGQF